MARTLTVGQTAPDLRFLVTDENGPVDLDTGVDALTLESVGPHALGGALTPDADQTQQADDGTTGKGWCSLAPAGDLDPGRYALKVKLVSGTDVFFFPEEGYEPLDVERIRRAFAAADDVARRLGRQLTAAEIDQVGWLLAMATDYILDAVDGDQEWGATVDPLPPVLTGVCVEMVVRVLTNPAGAVASSEQLGAYSRSVSFSQAQGATFGLTLTDVEGRLARRAVWGSDSGTARVRSTFNDVVVASGAVLYEDDRLDYA